MNIDRNSSVNDVEFVCIDFETTGLNHNADKILEVGAVRFTTSETRNTYQSFVCIEGDIPQGAVRVHEITKKMLSNAPDIKEVLRTTLDFIKDAVLVAHNIMFDFRFLNAELIRNGFSAIGSVQLVDTVTVSKKVIPELPKYSLESVAKYLNITGKYHRALDDALICKEVLLQCIREMSMLGELPLYELLI